MEIIQDNIKFKEWDCALVKHQYLDNKRIALELVDMEDGSPIAMATINMPEIKLDTDEVIIKDYSENEGMVDALKKANIIGDSLRVVPVGMVEGSVHKFLQ